MAYNSTIDKATDDILIYGNTKKDGAGTSYVPLLDTDGQLQVDVVASGLPTGASTLAEQQSQTTHLATIAGDTTAIETAVQLIDDTVTAQGTALGTTKTILNGGSVTTAAPTYTTGQISPLNMATTGALRVDVGATSANSTAIKVNVASGGIASGGIASGAIASGAIASGAIAAGAIAAGATSIADNEDVARAAADRLVKVAQVRVDAPPSGANVSGTEDYTQFIADLYGKTWVAGSVTEDVAHAAGESIMGSGTRRIDTPASSAGTSGDWATMDSSAEGALWVTQTPTTTGGLTIHKTDALVATAVAVKASAGNIYGYHIFNPNTADIYVHVYNIAQGSTTVGTSARTISMLVPGGGVLDAVFPMPLGFSTAITVAATTTLTGSSAPSTGLVTNIYYK